MPAQVRQAAITPEKTITITYTRAVNASAADYTGLVLAPGGSRTVTDVNGSGTSRHIVSYGGADAQLGANATINIAALADPDGFFAFGGAVNQTVSDARATSGSAQLVSLESNNGQLVATYTNPVNASAADYSIVRSDGRTPVPITAMDGGGSSTHTLTHEILANRTLVQVTVSYLADRGSGYMYAGTSQPWYIETTSTKSRAIANLTSLASNGTVLQAQYTHRVDGSASDYIITDTNEEPLTCHIPRR